MLASSTTPEARVRGRWRAPALFRWPVSLVLGGALLLFALLILAAGAWGPAALQALVPDNPEFEALLQQQGLLGFVAALRPAAWLCAAGCLLAGLLGLYRRPWTLFLIRLAYVAVALACGLYLYGSVDVWHTIRAAKVPIDAVEPAEFSAYWWEFKQLLPPALGFLACGGLWLVSWRRKTLAAYAASTEATPTAADQVVAWACGVARNAFGRSLGASVAAHACVILLPLLLMFLQTIPPYLIPYGRGLPDAGGGAKVSQKGSGTTKDQKKSAGKAAAEKAKPKLEIKLTQKPGVGRISFVFPSAKGKGPALLSEDAIQKFEEATQDQYKAETMTIVAGGRGSGTGGGFGPGNKAGGVGKGGVGPGGWPDGARGAVIRFVRIQYKGEDWDDGMAPAQRADVNFLEFFHREIGFKVATKGESYPIRLLKDCQKGYAPPFIYMTGANRIDVSQSECKILRDYLLDGGMLFADCGGPRWDRSFRQFIATLFPDKMLVNIPDDDVIFRHPFTFTNGAPPLWHHGGFRALGIWHQNRWVVFYHPGDMNDAWKTGYSGMDAEMAQRSLQLGVNILYYSFCNYLEATRKYRK